MNIYRKSSLIAVFLCLFLAISPVSIFAEGGDGTGGGTGENRDIPLTLESTSIEDGERGVALNETIQLNFNKNVCNVTVLANNKMCFHLTDTAGNAVAIKLIFPDNQVQKDYRREVFIQPLEDLSPNTSYRIAIDNTLMAKNGTTIDNAYNITFTTGTQRTDDINEILDELGDFTITYETSSGENENSVPVNKEGLDDSSETSGPSTGFIAKIAAAAIAVIIIAFSITVVIIRRKR